MQLDPRGVYTRADVLAAVSRRQLARLLDSGVIVQLRQGVYVSPLLPEPAQRAIRAGGVLGCISAAESYGLWRPPAAQLHVHFDRARSRRREALHVGHWWPTVERRHPTRTSLLDTLVHVVRCQPREFAVAVLDSALRSAHVGEHEVSELLRRVPARHRVSVDVLDGKAESGIESLVRIALRDAGLECVSQVFIAGIGRVDLLVEGRVIVEVDGRQWHQGQQARDYSRDLVAHAEGLGVVRVDYAHAVSQRELVVAAVRRALRRPRSLTVV
ncbi:MAG: DUF559 domain-containing protein [Microcella sp.]|uniref:type IV toxin-antitoxin system AbiEi family antitoxin domain-containing protein n=1 Tax=Microcella sp. TaxID=1913979 RepID=UPI0024CD5415|nr:type IV toxin-antitoxin system AbiEi family antitoxin domain-containing protein [Microcella sp.]UYN82642.1 MAG: DUF559 domain-containing protein [Microcella sp.]